MWFEDEMEENNAQPKTGNPAAHHEQLRLEKRRPFKDQDILEQTIQAPNSGQLSNHNMFENIENKSMHAVERRLPDLPDVSNLKSNFEKGKIPQDTDFNHLIDMAAVGCTAMGVVPGNSAPQPGPGLGLTPDNKLMVSAPIVSGTIVMFHGETIPDGWALCDGQNGRPNLIDRFIMGGGLKDKGETNNKVLEGDVNNKRFSATAMKSSIQSSLHIKVLPHKLTEAEMPSHRHHSSMRYLEYSLSKVSDSVKDEYTVVKNDIAKIYRIPDVMNYQNNWTQGHAQWIEDGWSISDTPSIYEGGHYPFQDLGASQNYQSIAYDWSSSTGEEERHSHEISVWDEGHSHEVDVEPPYIILAFIIKT